MFLSVFGGIVPISKSVGQDFVNTCLGDLVVDLLSLPLRKGFQLLQQRFLLDV
jgi:hypothetical protein